MNQELLTSAIAFFKEQNGTYESMKTQMLAGGISQAEIDQVYEEIKRLGLDPKANNAATTQTTTPTPAPIAPTEAAPATISIHPVSQKLDVQPPKVETPAPQPTTNIAEAPTPATQTAPEVAPQTTLPSSPTPTVDNTFHGATTDPPTTQAIPEAQNQTAQSTPQNPIAFTRPDVPVATNTTSSGNGLIVFMVILIVLGITVGGIFAYATYQPQSTLSIMIKSTLESFGVIPPQTVAPPPETPKRATTTTQTAPAQSISIQAIVPVSTTTSSTASTTPTETGSSKQATTTATATATTTK